MSELIINLNKQKNTTQISWYSTCTEPIKLKVSLDFNIFLIMLLFLVLFELLWLLHLYLWIFLIDNTFEFRSKNIRIRWRKSV